VKLKPSRYHAVSSSRICGGGPAQERLRILKAGRGKGKQPADPGLRPGGLVGTLSLTFFITQRDGVYSRSPMQADSLGVSGLAVAAAEVPVML
jgi:hypothetical protein